MNFGCFLAEEERSKIDLFQWWDGDAGQEARSFEVVVLPAASQFAWLSPIISGGTDHIN
jgi:hypothetical protein